jgi:hypothetical protein
MKIHQIEKDYRTALEEAEFYKNRDKAKARYYKARANSYKEEFEKLRRNS